jgi:hypothetical protein
VRVRLAFAPIALLATACPSRHEPPHPTASAAPSESAPAPLAPLTALTADPPIAPLHVDGFSDAVISIPTGATGPRAIVVATHGMWDFPEGLCDNWRWIIGTRAWVLCVRGTSMPDHTFFYKSGPALAKEIDAGVAALKARYPAYVDDGPMLYTGFSLGAILGAWIVTHDPARFPWANLTEGGEDKFSSQSAAAFVSGGGKHVLFACGLKGRVGTATFAAQRLTKAGAESRVVLGKLPDAGQFIHWYNGPVADEEKAQLAWLLADDPRRTAPP